MSWNYRILYDGDNYWIGEVYYDEADTPYGYTDASKDTLAWDDLSELQGTLDYVAQAKTRPVLRVDPKTEAILGEVPA